MNLKKPKFWDKKKPNFISYILLPFSILTEIIILFKPKKKIKIKKIKTICIGNIYIGGTGKTSLSIKINEILNKKNIKACFIKKFYKSQIDEQKLLKNHGKLFLAKKRIDALNQAVNENYNIAIFDDGLQDYSINYDINFVCFNNEKWIGNGMVIPSGPLRENIKILKNYKHIFFNGVDKKYYEIEEEALKINPQIIIHKGKYIPTNLNNFNKNENYIVFSGIGNHHTLISMLKESGIKIIKDIEFSDHYSYKSKDIKKIINLSKELNSKIITTEKDYLRLNQDLTKDINFIKSELIIEDEQKLINAILN